MSPVQSCRNGNQKSGPGKHGPLLAKETVLGPASLEGRGDRRRPRCGSLAHFQEKWKPVFRPKMRQRKNATHCAPARKRHRGKFQSGARLKYFRSGGGSAFFIGMVWPSALRK